MAECDNDGIRFVETPLPEGRCATKTATGRSRGTPTLLKTRSRVALDHLGGGSPRLFPVAIDFLY